MPLRRVNPHKPGEVLEDWSGPNLESFAQKEQPIKAEVVEKPGHVSPLDRLEREMEKRGWRKDSATERLGLGSYRKGNARAWVNQPEEEWSWAAYYNEYDEKGELAQSTESKAIDPDRPDMAVDELLKIVDDEFYRKKLREFWAKARAPPPEPTKTIEEAIVESLTTTFKGNEVTTENLRAQLSAYNIQVTDEELERVLSERVMGVIQTGRHTWAYQSPVDYSKWGQPEE